jgi:molybdopterin-containing oxidoreductase family membrane subunit
MSDPGSQVDVIGAFGDEHECVHAIEQMRAAGIDSIRAFSPVPCEHIVRALGWKKSPVRLAVLCGGIAGVTSGYALAIILSRNWPHIVGGKPVVSIPPFTIIGFELMILFGAISSLLSFLFFGRFPNLDEFAGYSQRFSSDQFGLVVRCTPEDAGRVEGLMRATGAEEVKREAA